MDLSKIDDLIEVLEEHVSLSKSGTPSNPTKINGVEGLWRTIRGFRAFLEYHGKDKPLGRVLIGPPSFLGQKLNDISPDTWKELTPRSTTDTFKDITPSSNGVDTLKQAIKNSLENTDTRNQALDSLNTPLQLVPIARSTGFTDGEIKSALSGVSPNKPLKNSTFGDYTKDKPIQEHRNMPLPANLPSNVVVLKPRSKKVEAPVEGTSARTLEEAPVEPPTPIRPNLDPETIKSNIAQLQGSLALSPEKLKGKGANKEESMANFLESVLVKGIKNDDILKQRVKDLANGLRSGKFTMVQVHDEVRDITTNYSKVKVKQFDPNARTALKDSAAIKKFIDHFDAKIEEKINEGIDRASGKFKPKESPVSGVSDTRIKELANENRPVPAAAQAESQKQRDEIKRLREEAAASRQKAQEFMSAAQVDKLRVEAAIALLSDLSAKVDNQKMKQEIKHIISNVSKGSFSKRSILLRLYQLLQILFLLIPGL